MDHNTNLTNYLTELHVMLGRRQPEHQTEKHKALAEEIHKQLLTIWQKARDENQLKAQELGRQTIAIQKESAELEKLNQLLR